MGNQTHRTSRFWSLWFALQSLAFAGISGAAAWAMTAAPPTNGVLPESRKPIDYLAHQKQFIAEGDLSSAIILGDFVSANPDLPNAAEIVRVRDEAEKTYDSWWSRAKRAAAGFGKGQVSDGWGFAGDTASNFLFYGNIRDLTKEAYHKVTGDPVDEFTVVLSSIGLAADIATVFPLTAEAGVPAETGFSLLKALKRAGALTNDFAETILGLAKNAKSAEQAEELGRCVVGTCKLYKVLPTGSIGYVMKTVHSEEELAHVAKVAEAAPKEVALIERLGSEEGIAQVNAPTASKGSLSEYLKFGPKAVRTVALPASWGVSTMKTFRGFVGHLHDLLPAPVREAATGFFALCALLGVTNAVRHFRAAFAKTEGHLTQTATPPVSA